MKDELTVALKFKKMGYKHVIQITTEEYKLKKFGDPIFLNSADEAGPLLRTFRKRERAKILWAISIDDYIKNGGSCNE